MNTFSLSGFETLCSDQKVSECVLSLLTQMKICAFLLLILFYFDEFFTPPPTNTLFVLDGHRGRKLLKSCSNTSLAIRVSAKRMLCAAAAPPALG